MKAIIFILFKCVSAVIKDILVQLMETIGWFPLLCVGDNHSPLFSRWARASSVVVLNADSGSKLPGFESPVCCPILGNLLASVFLQL